MTTNRILGYLLALVCVAAPFALKPADAGEEGVLRLAVADWVPKRTTDGWWGVVPAGVDARQPMLRTNSETSLRIASGRYDVYWVQDFEGRARPLKLAAGVVVSANSEVAIAANSGMRLRKGGWVPARTNDGWWGAVPAGGDPQKPVSWTKTNDAVLLSPGRYDVYWVQDFETRSRPLRLAQNLEIGAGSVAQIEADSGIRLDVADWVPKRTSDGWWGAVLAGGDPQQPANWTKLNNAVLLPPGRYDVYWVQDFDNHARPLKLAAGVVVSANSEVAIAANSGMRLRKGGWVPARTSDGWWGAVPAGGDPQKPVSWTKTNDAMLLPPGRYDVYWVQDFKTRSRPLRLAQNLEIGAGSVAQIEADSGIRLDVADWVPKRTSDGWWGAVLAGGDPQQPANWTKLNNAVLLPPGRYDVYWVQDFDNRARPLLLAAGVAVRADMLATVAANSGLQLRDQSVRLDPRDGWWGVVATGQPVAPPIMSARGHADQPLLVPPGVYDVVLKPDGASEPERKRTNVLVGPGMLVDVDFNTQPQGLSSVIKSFVLEPGMSLAGDKIQSGTSRVSVHYSWSEAQPGRQLGVRWVKGKATILEQTETLLTASGETGWILQTQDGSALPAGQYTAELLEDGRPTRSISFSAPE